MLFGRFGRLCLLCVLAVLDVLGQPVARASAQDSQPGTVLDIRFTPTRRAQIAIWIEDADGTFVSTELLTELTARRGIGNRPGASQMNSGYRWPYGRREGVLPIWATRRASAPGAKQFKRVIFQDRYSEGRASRTTSDHSPDGYYCLSFNPAASNRDSLDAVSCASGVFTSDKGRFMTQDDVDRGYAEPFEDPQTQQGVMAVLPLTSLYPPRWDSERCNAQDCFDHTDMTSYRRHVLDVMPEIDAIATATLQGDVERHELVSVPDAWPNGDYMLWLEINVEGDYNDVYNETTFATPTTPLTNGVGTLSEWDQYAVDWGYAYRGQPSVAYRVPFSVGDLHSTITSTDTPIGAGSWDWRDPRFGQMVDLDTISDEPDDAPGSGADRLRRHAQDGARLQVTVRPPTACEFNTPPSAIDDLRFSEYENFRHRHEWAHLSFTAASDDDRLNRYEVRVSEQPMTNVEEFLTLGVPAKSATTFNQELMIPIDNSASISVDFGGMRPSTQFFIGVRAVDICNAPGPLTFGTITTTEQQFTTVTPCFVATAAYGTPLSSEIGALRHVRDRFLAPNALGRALIDAYYSVGPSLAAVIRDRSWLRELTQSVLSPIVWLSAQLASE